MTINRYSDILALQPRWLAFEREACGTLYQTALWCRAWTETVAPGRGAEPVVITLERGGSIRALLPFQIRRRQGVRVLEWLTAPHHGYGAPLLARDFSAAEAQQLAGDWPRITAEAGSFDAMAFAETPERLFGWDNPLWPQCNLATPNLSYVLALGRDFEAINRAKCGAERRRGARKHEAALQRAGGFRFGLPADREELHGLIDTMFGQQEKRLAEHGIRRAFGPDEHRFIHRLADLQDEGDPVLAPYHLSAAGAVQAVALGGLHGGRYWALISSLAQGPLRRHSPGDTALRLTIRACCERGLEGFDFSAGAAAYKSQWADDVVRLGVILRGRNGRGVAWAGAMALWLTAKRLVKQTPLLLGTAQAVRRGLFGSRAS